MNLNVKFDKSRFRRYIGNIGEMVAQEALMKEGFEVWLLTPYFPVETRKKLPRSGLLTFLSYLYKQPDENSLQSLYKVRYCRMG